MPIPDSGHCRGAAPTDAAAISHDARDDDVLNAVITAACLVASADGRSTPAERKMAMDFLADSGFLATFSRAEILEAFDQRVFEVSEDGASARAIAGLGQFAGLAPARVIVNAGEQVAAADGYLSPQELHMLRLIRTALSAPSYDLNMGRDEP